jgi:hypothetical protein
MFRWQPWPFRYILASLIMDMGSASRASCSTQTSKTAACLQPQPLTAALHGTNAAVAGHACAAAVAAQHFNNTHVNTSMFGFCKGPHAGEAAPAAVL